MDKVYRVFQRGDDPKSGEVVKNIAIKSIIVEPLNGEILPVGMVAIRGAAYAGESGIEGFEISVDNGQRWNAA